MPNQLGKRFVCETCNTEVLCIKPGEGEDPRPFGDRDRPLRAGL